LEAVQPPRALRPTRSVPALPPARKTIAALEEREEASAGVGRASALLLSSGVLRAGAGDRAPPAADAEPRQPAGMFETMAIWRAASRQLGVPQLPRMPLLSDRVVIEGQPVEDTRQAYALAEAVRAVAPREVCLEDVSMTDMGAGRIVETAVACGRLLILHISGSYLNHRTCAALFVHGHRGATIQDLSLVHCGLGGDLPLEDSADLPPASAKTYAKCKAILLGREEPEEDESSTPWPWQPPAGQVPAGRVTPMPVALPVFAQLVRLCSATRRLDLSGHQLSATAVQCLSHALASAALEELQINCCGIPAESTDVLAAGLGKNRGLLWLGLRGSLLDAAPSSLSALLDSAGRHMRLAHLDIAESPLYQDCFRDLCAALRWSCSLLAVHVLGGAPFVNASKVDAGIRQWIAQHGASTATAVSRGGSRSTQEFNDSPKLREDTEGVTDHDIDEEAEELVISRALHIEGLAAWRVAPAQPRAAVPGPEAQQPAGSGQMAATKTDAAAVLSTSLDQRAGARQDAPCSWMPGCCWICGRCRTVEYRWTVPDQGEGSDSGAGGARLFLRPSFADFEQIELRRCRGAGERRVQFATRMLVPPGSHCHLFETNSAPSRSKVALGSTGERSKGKAEQAPPTLLHATSEPTEEDMSKLPISEHQLDRLQRLCVQLRYAGPTNLRSIEAEEGRFQIPESIPPEDPFEAEPDPWAETPARAAQLRGCFEADLPQLRLSELCRADEEAEVTQVLWELYDHLYETYAIYAGRSQWPLVRHVDVYAFFDEAKLLQANLPIAASMALAAGEVRPKGRASDSEEGPALNEEGLVREITARTPLQLASGHGTILLQDVKLILMQTRAKGGTGQQDGACAGQLSASRQRRTEIAHQQAIEGAPITRPQFIEMLARTAIATRSDNPPVAVALRSFVDCVLARHVFRAPLARFPRGLQCQPGEVRDKLLAGRKTLLEAWERYGGSEVSFQRFAQLLRINDQHFTAKHVASVYALARQPDPAAILRPASVGLGFNEFCEAVARMGLTWQAVPRATQRLAPSRADATAPHRAGQFALPSGHPVRQKAIAAHIEAFLAKVEERLKPSVKGSHSLL